MRKLLITLLSVVVISAANGQSKSDIFNKDVSLTWLGIDFTQVNFIGNAAQWQDAGEIDSDQLRERYFAAWNEIFLNEKEKYNVAEFTHKNDVEYAIEVVATPNSKSDRDYFESDAGKFRHLNEAKIKKLVSAYNFKGHTGLGLIFFVEGMHKEAKKSSLWVVYVNMANKTVLLAERMDAKAGGFGFRNYWAKSFFNALKAVDGNLNKWEKK